ncbi:hypothetical protein [Halonotius roseus]|uniref:Uncharacterized protein n=1 Tax=Halonotius roseus TaxID=2511997 RepID=A0A544QKS3_9EURY|nr:hypothetical protein [Halonotius roseus]TQQ78966.1 hypothetical protein EWF95_12605 [Halonotius roseus]
MSDDDPLARPSGRDFGLGPIMVVLLLLVAVAIAGVVGLLFLAEDLVVISPGTVEVIAPRV